MSNDNFKSNIYQQPKSYFQAIHYCFRIDGERCKMMDFKSRLKQRRIELGLSQLKLAKRVGMSQSGIALLENGRNHETTKIVDIAIALETTPEWLLGNSQISTPTSPNTDDSEFFAFEASPIALRKSYISKMRWDEKYLDFFIQTDDSMSSTIYSGDCVVVDRRSVGIEENKVFLIQRDRAKKSFGEIGLDREKNIIYRYDNLDKTRFSDTHPLPTDIIVGRVVWSGGGQF